MNAIADESGQTLIFVALAMTCVLGFVGLATDVSSMLHDKRIVQTAADTAALAAGTEYLYVSTVPSDVKKAGKDATQADGITDGTNGTVTINVPPLYGPHAGAAGYVEAIVQKTDHRYFLGLVGASTATVSARAVAWTGAPSTSCFDVLSPSASPAVQLTGSYNVGIPGCGMMVDSSADPAMSVTGKSNASYLDAKYVGVVGSVSGTVRNGATPVSGVVPVNDPLAGILPVYTCTATSCTETLPNGDTSAGPACVTAPTAAGSTWGPASSDGAVCYNNTSIPGNITLNPGTYIFTGNVSLGGNKGITANAGITFYFTTGSLTMIGTPNIVITAPSAATNPGDPFAGIAYVQAPGDTSIFYVNGDSSGLFDGIIYAPDAEMQIQGNTTIDLPELIVGTFNDTGNATINITQTLPAGSNPIKSVVLVE